MPPNMGNKQITTLFGCVYVRVCVRVRDCVCVFVRVSVSVFVWDCDCGPRMKKQFLACSDHVIEWRDAV